MKIIKRLLFFVGLMALCDVASAEPITAAYTAFSAWAASASVPTILSIASTAVSAYGALEAGASAKEDAAARNAQALNSATMSEYQAEQLDQQAGQQRAVAQRQAAEQRRQAKIVASRAQAVAGGGSTDASVLGLTGNIAGEGEYNALSALYEGEDKAKGLEMQGASARGQAGQYRASGQAALARGERENTAAQIGAVGTIFKGASSLYSKYGNGGVENSPGDGMSQGDRRKIGVY